MQILKLLLIPFIAMLQGVTMIDESPAKDSATRQLNQCVLSEVPGLQYMAQKMAQKMGTDLFIDLTNQDKLVTTHSMTTHTTSFGGPTIDKIFCGFLKKLILSSFDWTQQAAATIAQSKGVD